MTTRTLTAIIADALVDAALLNRTDLERAIEVIGQENSVREALGDVELKAEHQP